MLADDMKNISGYQKAKYIIITAFFVVNFILLIISFRMNIDDLRFSIKIARYIPYMKYIVLLNIILVVSILTMFYSEILKIKNNNKANEEELVRIKSKLYDIEKKKSSLENADGIKSY
jgi:uncharacterized membrane protein (UPF0182 family)